MIPTVQILQELLVKQLLSILGQNSLSVRLLPEYRIAKINIYKMLDELHHQVSLDEISLREIRLNFSSDIYAFVQESPDEIQVEKKFFYRPDYLRNFIKTDFETKHSIEHTNTLDFMAMLLGYAGWGGAQSGVRFNELVLNYQHPYELINEVKPSPEN